MNYLYFKPKEAFRIEALKTASTFALALIVSNLFNIQYGYWIVFTIAILYFAGAYHGFIINRLNRRIFGIIAGLAFGVYFLTLFSYETYWYLYFSPLFFFLGFYSYFLSRGNYFYLAFFLAIYFLVIVAVQTPPSEYMNLPNITFSRFACTIFAVVIIIFVDIIFLSKTTLPKLSTIPLVRNIILSISESIETQNRDFIAGKKNRDAAWDTLFYVGAKIASIEEVVKHISNELCFIDLNESRYTKLLFHLAKVRSNIENMIFISNHYGETDIKNPDLLHNLHLNSKELVEAYLTSAIRLDENSMEYLYLKNLHSSLWHLNRIQKQTELIDKS